MGMLRVALALVVVFAHAGVHTSAIDPGLAVQAFFIISGFYMALILESKYRSVLLFYSNRLLRLFPSYLVVLAAAAIALLVFDINSFVRRDSFLAAVSDPATGWALVGSNLTLIGQDILCWFDLSAPHQFVLDRTFSTEGPNTAAWTFLLVPQAWSLSLELAFFVLAPMLVRLPWLAVVAVAAASVAVRFAGMNDDTNYYLWPQRMFPAELFLFLLGMLAHRAKALAAMLPKVLGVLVVAILLALVGFEDKLNLDLESGRWLVYAGFAFGLPFAFNVFKRSRTDAAIGELSYPIYISHLLVLAALDHFAPQHRVAILLGGVLGLSLALRFLVEHPIDQWRQRRAQAQLSPQPLGGAA